MDIIEINSPVKGPSAIFMRSDDFLKDSMEDLPLLQKQREILLEKAECLFKHETQSGCVSDISVIENVLDGDEYQNVLREISQLLQGSSDHAAVLQKLDLRVDIKIECYDDITISGPSVREHDSNVLSVSEDDVECYGYMGWIVR